VDATTLNLSLTSYRCGNKEERRTTCGQRGTRSSNLRLGSVPPLVRGSGARYFHCTSASMIEKPANLKDRTKLFFFQNWLDGPPEEAPRASEMDLKTVVDIFDFQVILCRQRLQHFQNCCTLNTPSSLY
jgi:hypothetical protein